MLNHKLQSNRAYTIVNQTRDAWFIESQNGQRGPYRNAVSHYKLPYLRFPPRGNVARLLSCVSKMIMAVLIYANW